MTPCPRMSWWFGGCRFEPRYDRASTPTDFMANWHVVEGPAAEAHAVAIGPRYIGDICVRCGAWSKELVPKASAVGEQR